MRGSLRQRAKGSWTLKVYVGRDPETGVGRYAYETVRGTKRDAEARLAELIHGMETGSEINAKRLTVAEYLEKWLEAREKKVKRTTIDGYRILIRAHIVPLIGNVRLSKLRPLHVEKLHAAVRGKGLSETSVLHVHRCLFAALRQAVRWQLVARNVAESVEAPRPERHRVEAMEPEDASRVLKAVAGTPLEVPTILALGTGMRRGEVLGLRWSDIDLETGQARVVQQVTSDGSFDTPKTHRSVRPVALPPFVLDALRRHRVAQNERRLICGEAWQDFDLVIDRGDGAPMRPDVLSKRFGKVARREGLGLTFHGLRHGYATLMLTSGVSLKVTQGLLGHSTFAITADLYTHVAEKADTEAAGRLDSLLFPTTLGNVSHPPV